MGSVVGSFDSTNGVLRCEGYRKGLGRRTVKIEIKILNTKRNCYQLVLRESNILPAAKDDGSKNNKENTKLIDLLLFSKMIGKLVKSNVEFVKKN